MKFLIDADLPRSTARALTAEGHEARHVGDVGLSSASDRDIFDHAQVTQAVLVTRDLDFTDPLKFPEKQHHGLIIIRIREVLPPVFVNRVLVDVLRALLPKPFDNAVVIVEEQRYRRRVIS
jgi:predicted nuclease of predicted toxin-antitoxin system